MMLESLVCAAVAALVVSLELVTTEYSQTYRYVLKCKAFYMYLAVYAAIAFGIRDLLDYLIASGSITLAGIGLDNPWVLSVLLGVTVKSFLHIRLLTVNMGSQAVPVGVETVVLLFEPWLLRQIKVCEYNHREAFITPIASRYSDLKAFKTLAKSKIPPRVLSSDEVAAMKVDIDGSETVFEAMDHFLKNLGPDAVAKAFDT